MNTLVMRLQSINYLRVFAVVSLVVWHVYYCPVLVPVWGRINNPDPWVYNIHKWTSSLWIPDANMPLFTFISGFLFAYLIGGGKYQRWWPFVWNKTKRLLIPFATLGTVITLTSVNPDNYIRMRNISLLYGEGSHMWFVIMLFWCFLVAWPVTRGRYKIVNVVLGLASFYLYVFYDRNTIYRLPLGLHNTALYYCWFMFGYYVCIIDKVFHLSHKRVFFVFSVMALCVYLYPHLHLGHFERLAVKVYPAFFILAVYCFAAWMSDKGVFCQRRWIDRICWASMGIYVLHHWIAWDFYHIPYIGNLLEQHQIAFPAITTLVVFALSYELTVLCKNTRVGNFLLK